ncbi:MAG TPA: thrombospondin type 3 repeat-containing protein [Polyangiaceae bacterium]
MWIRKLARLTAVGAIALGPRVATATPTFPDAIARHLGTSIVPQCTVCHDGTPTKGTATSAFAGSMRSRGLMPNDASSLTAALDALDGEKTDSDGDGFPDIDELRKGWDPNVPNGADGKPLPGAGRAHTLIPEYGCSLPSRRVHVQGASAVLLCLAALAAVSRRRRSQRA